MRVPPQHSRAYTVARPNTRTRRGIPLWAVVAAIVLALLLWWLAPLVMESDRGKAQTPVGSLVYQTRSLAT